MKINTQHLKLSKRATISSLEMSKKTLKRQKRLSQQKRIIAIRIIDYLLFQGNNRI
jgi:hypothetical protein